MVDDELHLSSSPTLKTFQDTAQTTQAQTYTVQTALYLWGRNHFGQLGMPIKGAEKDQDDVVHKNATVDPNVQFLPVEASLPHMDVAQICCGEEHTAMLTKDGKIFTMGSNASGQIGVPVKCSRKASIKPEKVTQPNDSISTGRDTQSGADSIVNQNKYSEPIPILIPNVLVVKIACGEQHTLAMTKRGQVYAWGQARYGALGIDFAMRD